MSKKEEKPEVKESAKIEFSLQEANVILAVYDLAIRAPQSDVDGLSRSKLALTDRFSKAFKG